jgi:hypothetical protein
MNASGRVQKPHFHKQNASLSTKRIVEPVELMKVQRVTQSASKIGKKLNHFKGKRRFWINQNVHGECEQD